MTYKTIFKGQLEFGSPKSYAKALQMYQHRVETFYKHEVLFEEEDIFNEEALSLSIPRIVTHSIEKNWKNTASLFEYVAQYAMSGTLYTWVMDEREIKHYVKIEPDSDKVAVKSYLKGRELIKVGGKEKEAMDALTKAIEKFERHAQAYERRGYVNLKLKNYDDAIYDFSKSIDLNPKICQPHLGRAKVRMIQNDWKSAIADLEQSIKKSIPLMPIYWQSRRIKAECHINLKEFDESAKELKFFLARKFTEDNPNFAWRKQAYFSYGKSLLEIGEHKESVIAFNKAIDLGMKEESGPDADQYLYRGIARQRGGESGFTKDWAEAAERGSKEATKLLELNNA